MTRLTPSEDPLARQTLVQALLRVGAVLALVLLAWWLVDVLLLTFAGILIAVLLRAPADWLADRTRLSPNLAIALVLVVLVLGGGGVIWAIAPEIIRQGDEMLVQIPKTVRELTTSLEEYKWGQLLLARADGASEMLERPETLQSAGRVLSSSFGAFASLFVVIVVGLWVTLQPRLYIDNAIRLVPVHARPKARAIASECGHVLQRWLVGSMVSMLIVGGATWIGLWALGVPLALVLAMLAGVMVFIPNFGPILSVVPAILLAVTQGPMMAVWVALLYIGVQAIENTTVTPLIQRQAVSLPPALTMLAQAAMGVLAGGLGLIVAVPLMAITMVIVHRTYVERIEQAGAQIVMPTERPAIVT